MIVGSVQRREPVIRLTVRGSRGRQEQIQAVVDPGYTGWLTLPPALMGRLNLPWKTFGRGIMADGSVSAFDVYQARVMWDSRLRQVLVSELDATPLVGMALLRGFEIRMLVKARGKVTIERISKP